MITEPGMHHRVTTRGFTLTEAMLAVTLLGFAAAGVLLPFVGGAAVRAEGTRRTLGAELASGLMEQIVKTPFDQIVPGYNYAELQGQVKDATGVVFTDPKYANYSRSVVCEYVRVPGESVLVPEKFIRITVQVDYSGKNVATLSRLVSK